MLLKISCSRLFFFYLALISFTNTLHALHHHKMRWWEHRVFVPSHSNLLSQNMEINKLNIIRVSNDKILKELIIKGDLVPLTNNKYVRINPRLEKKRRYCRPWVDVFLQDFGREYYDRFQASIQVNSAIRTVKTQTWLRRWNSNAAPVHGETASAHLTGIAVDLQRRGLTPAQVKFIQEKLLYLVNLHMLIVEEELKSGQCFHIVVTGDYPTPPNMVISNEKGKTFNEVLN